MPRRWRGLLLAVGVRAVLFQTPLYVQSVITSVMRNEQKHACNSTLETAALGRWRTPRDMEGPGENKCSQLEEPGWSRAAVGSIGPQGPARGCPATRPTKQWGASSGPAPPKLPAAPQEGWVSYPQCLWWRNRVIVPGERVEGWQWTRGGTQRGLGLSPHLGVWVGG